MQHTKTQSEGISGRDGKTLCDKMPYIYNNNDEIHFYLTDTDRIRAFVPISTEDTDEFDFVCTLAEPIEIQLDPLTISTLIGDNTIWTDTNGENTVRYKKKG